MTRLLDRALEYPLTAPLVALLFTVTVAALLGGLTLETFSGLLVGVLAAVGVWRLMDETVLFHADRKRDKQEEKLHADAFPPLTHPLGFELRAMRARVMAGSYLDAVGMDTDLDGQDALVGFFFWKPNLGDPRTDPQALARYQELLETLDQDLYSVLKYPEGNYRHTALNQMLDLFKSLREDGQSDTVRASGMMWFEAWDDALADGEIAGRYLP